LAGGLVTFDKLTCMNTGLILAMVISHLLWVYFSQFNSHRFHAPWRWNFLFGFGIFSAFFTLWEVGEVLVQNITGTHLVSSYFDTSEDLLANTAGYFVGFIMTWAALCWVEQKDVDFNQGKV